MGFSTSTWQPASRASRTTAKWPEVGTATLTALDLRQELPVIVKGPSPQRLGHFFGPGLVEVGHPHQFRVLQMGVLLGVEAAQVADPDDPDFDWSMSIMKIIPHHSKSTLRKSLI